MVEGAVDCERGDTAAFGEFRGGGEGATEQFLVDGFELNMCEGCLEERRDILL